MPTKRNHPLLHCVIQAVHKEDDVKYVEMIKNWDTPTKWLVGGLVVLMPIEIYRGNYLAWLF